MRLPFLRPKPAPAEAGRRGAAAGAAAGGGDSLSVEAARTRARRRLVGALVLLVIGVVGFPIVFETQPRPLPVDTPIVVGDARPGPSAPATRTPPLPVLTERALPGEPSTPVAGSAPAPGTSPAPAAAPTPTPAAVRQDSRTDTAAATPPRPAPLPVITERAEPATPRGAASAPVARSVAAAASAAAPRPVAATAASAPAATRAVEAAASGPGRYVVQVGAFSDPATLREARSKVERLGLKTYTQVVGSDAGQRTRVRLGPFATREEADAAAAKVKRAGLPAAILTL
jgi:DedD protein